MATGDANDMLRRLRALLPARWFPDDAPIVDAVLYGPATTLAYIYALIQYTKLQTRINTATGGFLDLALYDFFKRRIRRKASQSDASLRVTIETEVLRERTTRPGLQHAVSDLTRNAVTIFEPPNPQDTGGWGHMFAFNKTGAWGSQMMPYTVLLTAIQPQGAGIPNISGFNSPQSGFGAGLFFFADVSTVVGEVMDQDIYDTIEATRAAGITVWVSIVPPPFTVGRLDIDFVLDKSLLG